MLRFEKFKITEEKMKKIKKIKNKLRNFPFQQQIP